MSQLLNKNDVVNLLKQNDKSVILMKRKKTAKSSSMWDHFSVILVNDIEQELVCCDICKDLLVYCPRDGTASIAKHHRSCRGHLPFTTNTSKAQTKITEYYTSSKTFEVPKRFRQKVKMACTEFVALDCRPFEVLSGEGFLKLAQSIFDAGRCSSHFSNVNVEQLIPSPVTISRHVDHVYEQQKAQLISLCSSLSTYCLLCDFWTERFTGVCYCGLALRCITKDFQLQHFVLGCFLYDLDSQSAGNVRAFVDSQLLAFGLALTNSIFIVTDCHDRWS